MAINAESGIKPEETSSKDELKNPVETLDYGLKIRITKFSDGSQTCNVRDVTVDNTLKDTVPEMPVASKKKEAPVSAVPLGPVEATSRTIPDGKDNECSVCEALANALREQVKAAAPRRQLSSRERPLRRVA